MYVFTSSALLLCIDFFVLHSFVRPYCCVALSCGATSCESFFIVLAWKAHAAHCNFKPARTCMLQTMWLNGICNSSEGECNMAIHKVNEKHLEHCRKRLKSQDRQHWLTKQCCCIINTIVLLLQVSRRP